MIQLKCTTEKIRLSKFLFEKCGFNYNLCMRLLRKKDICVNNIRIKADIFLNVNDNITVYYNGDNFSQKVIYEDENIIILYKPKGILSNGENSFNTLVNKENNFILCHRLDTNTDGLLVFAKNNNAYNELYNAFKNRSMEKFYIAKIHGVPQKKEDSIKAYLTKNTNDGIVYISDKESKNSVLTITEYKILQVFESYSVAEIKLITGKTHQIRAIMKHIGYPIIGDSKYGNTELDKKFKKSKQQLTFYKLTFKFDSNCLLYYLNNKTFEIDI